MKDENLKPFLRRCKEIQTLLNLSIILVRSDHGKEFDKLGFDSLCEKYGIIHNFSASRNPQQNGVVEMKIRALAEMARTMPNENELAKYYWAEAVNTVNYVLNRCRIRLILKKTPYELSEGRKPNISYLRPFGCKCFIHNNDKDNLVKIDARSDEGIFQG